MPITSAERFFRIYGDVEREARAAMPTIAIVALVIVFVGSLGGLANALLAGNSLVLPSAQHGFIQPGD